MTLENCQVAQTSSCAIICIKRCICGRKEKTLNKNLKFQYEYPTEKIDGRYICNK